MAVENNFGILKNGRRSSRALLQRLLAARVYQGEVAWHVELVRRPFLLSSFPPFLLSSFPPLLLSSFPPFLLRARSC